MTYWKSDSRGVTVATIVVVVLVRDSFPAKHDTVLFPSMTRIGATERTGVTRKSDPVDETLFGVICTCVFMTSKG